MADDLTQDTLLAAVESPPQRSAEVRPWLARVLRNKRILGLRRRENQRARERECAQQEALPSADELVARGEVQKRLVETVLELSEPHRSLVLLRYYEGLSPGEIARRLDRPAGTVRGQLFRAHAELRRRLNDRLSGDELDWRAALLPLAEMAEESGRNAEPPTSFSGPATLVAMPMIAKLVVGATALGSLLWFALERPLEGTSPATVDIEGAVPERSASSRTDSPASRTSLGHPLEVSRGRFIAPRTGEVLVTAPVRGHLRVVESGAPLGGFLLELRNDEAMLERFETNDEGYFESAQPYGRGELTIALLDHAELDEQIYSGTRELYRLTSEAPRSIRWQPGDSLDLAVGPRLELRLTISGPEAAIASLTRVHLSSRVSGNIEAFRVTTPLRRDERGLWVRFPALDRLPIDELGPFTLHASSPDGLWSAETAGPEQVRIHSLPFELYLEPRARLEVTVPWRDVEPEGATATLGSKPMAREHLPDSRATVFSIGGIEEGTYPLTVWAEATEPVRESLTLTAGMVTRTTLELDPPREKVVLRVRLRSETGNFHSLTQFAAHSAGQRSFLGGQAVWELESGEWIGTQEIPVPAGEYELRPFLVNSSVPWDRTSRIVHAPGPPLELLALDGGLTETLTLQVADARTGEPVAGATAQLLPGGESVMFNRPERPDNGTAFVWREVHHADRAAWSVEADGYLPATGDWSTASRDRSTRWFEVHLEPKP